VTKCVFGLYVGSCVGRQGLATLISSNTAVFYVRRKMESGLRQFMPNINLDGKCQEIV
jgi:hypothetical protein